VAELKAGIAMKAFVVRNGKEMEIAARELVPGDIVIISTPLRVSVNHVRITIRSSWRKETQFPRMRRCDSRQKEYITYELILPPKILRSYDDKDGSKVNHDAREKSQAPKQLSD
jgi:hypothetical protein